MKFLIEKHRITKQAFEKVKEVVVTLYAHTDDSNDGLACQRLEDHLSAVSEMASSFAERFGMGSWGRALGILHDAGKSSEAFQRRLQGSDQHVDHSTAGARIALDRYGEYGVGRLLAYAIAGHHGGQPNGIASSQGAGSSLTPLEQRLQKEVEPYDAFFDLLDESDSFALPSVSELGLPFVPHRKAAPSNDVSARCFSIYVLARMLYSSLVDADYLDTEHFMTPDASQARNDQKRASIPELLEMLQAHLATKSSTDSPVNRARQAVLSDCVAAAELEPGLFSLTVPTGGGKTLSSLAFALKHAKQYGMDRVIIAIPFTSIVDQTAAVLKDIFGSANVLEHHSNYDFSDLDDEEGYAQRLTAQNWDAPIVVTTNVQLFESLFANKPGKSRKIHSIANSVIILDEAQTLPDSLLTLSLAMLEELTFGYGATIVLCTATQPALDMVWPFGSKPREITAHKDSFAEAFGSRMAYETVGILEKDQLISQLSEYDQVLCVVGTKAEACEIYRGLVAQVDEGSVLYNQSPLNVQGYFHLSAAMTPSHRSEVLDQVRQRLKEGKRCIVVSTQLVEAGVDVDFPVVYRELAGIDSLVQAAGRCNREGRNDAGIVRVFEYAIEGERQRTSPWLEKMKDIARSLIEENGGTMSEDLVRPFFEVRYQTEDLDAKGLFARLIDTNIVRSAFKPIPFEQIAIDYRIIDEDTVPLFIPRGSDGAKELEKLLAAENPAALSMRLQRHSVSVPRWLSREYEQTEAFESIGPFLVLREDRLQDFYRDDVGLVKPGEEEFRPLFF